MPFWGLRRSEAEKIEWGEISDEFIEVKAHKAKTRRRRLVPISSHLRAWLECARQIGGKLPSLNYADKFKRTLQKAGLRAGWPQNALRHSFASYHYAKYRNENETAALMGNSPQMIFAHYRELVRPALGDAFFALLPPADAVPRVRIARAKQTLPVSMTDCLISAQASPELCAPQHEEKHGKRGNAATVDLKAQAGKTC